MNVMRHENQSFRSRGPYSRFRPGRQIPPIRINSKQTDSFEIHRIARTPSTRSSGGNRRYLLSTSSSGGRPFSTPSDRRTPRSANSSSTESESSCIVAISEGRGQARGEVGIAAIDIHRPHLILCQISDGQTYMNTLTKLHIFNPMEVIIPNTFCDTRTPSKVFLVLREQCSHINLTCVQRRHFNDVNGRKLVNLLCAAEYSSVELLLTHKFYALSAAAALLKYVEYIQNLIFAPKSLKIEYQASQNTTFIDVDTAMRLELVVSLVGNQGEGRGWGQRRRPGGVDPKPSLLGILNNCYTAGGLRLLRASILQPSCLPSVINTRLESVAELASNTSLSGTLGTILGQLSDVEQLLTLCMVSPDGPEKTSGEALLRQAESRINYALLLKTSLSMVSPLLESLKETVTPHLRALQKTLDDPSYGEMLEQINEILHDDARTSKGFASSHLQRCFAVKPGINGLLDVARKTYSEIVGDITVYVGELVEEHGLNLRVNYTATRGFHVQLIPMDNNVINESELPPEFIQVQKMGRSLTFVTQELIEYDMRCKVALQEIQTMSNVVVMELLGKLRERIGSLYKFCEVVATLDVLLSLSRVSSIPGYCCPHFNTSLNIVNARHPLLDFFGSREPVPNNVYASNYFNFHVITGPNMSGKSIYIKMIALLQIMAQVGCYVPAERATFRIANRIFSRIGFDDSLECNASTFVLELKEMQYILQYLTPTSLVIVDELCRGTSVEEGTSIAWSLSEALINSNAFVFLTTHFHFLTKLSSVYPNVTNYHLRTEEQAVEEESENEGSDGETEKRIVRSRLKYTHRLEPGVTTIENYGLRLAEVSGLPKSIISEAQRIHSLLSKGRKPLPVVEANVDLEFKLHQIMGEILHLGDDVADRLNDEENTELDKKNTFSQFMKIMEDASNLGSLPSFSNSDQFKENPQPVAVPSTSCCTINEKANSEAETEILSDESLEEPPDATASNSSPISDIHCGQPDDSNMMECSMVECEVSIEEE